MKFIINYDKNVRSFNKQSNLIPELKSYNDVMLILSQLFKYLIEYSQDNQTLYDQFNKHKKQSSQVIVMIDDEASQIELLEGLAKLEEKFYPWFLNKEQVSFILFTADFREESNVFLQSLLQDNQSLTNENHVDQIYAVMDYLPRNLALAKQYGVTRCIQLQGYYTPVSTAKVSNILVPQSELHDDLSERLSDDLWVQILSYLNDKDISRMRLTNRRLNQLILNFLDMFCEDKSIFINLQTMNTSDNPLNEVYYFHRLPIANRLNQLHQSLVMTEIEEFAPLAGVIDNGSVILSVGNQDKVSDETKAILDRAQYKKWLDNMTKPFNPSLIINLYNMIYPIHESQLKCDFLLTCILYQCNQLLLQEFLGIINQLNEKKDEEILEKLFYKFENFLQNVYAEFKNPTHYFKDKKFFANLSDLIIYVTLRFKVEEFVSYTNDNFYDIFSSLIVLLIAQNPSPKLIEFFNRLTSEKYIDLGEEEKAGEFIYYLEGLSSESKLTSLTNLLAFQLNDKKLTASLYFDTKMQGFIGCVIFKSVQNDLVLHILKLNKDNPERQICLGDDEETVILYIPESATSEENIIKGVEAYISDLLNVSINLSYASQKLNTDQSFYYDQNQDYGFYFNNPAPETPFYGSNSGFLMYTLPDSLPDHEEKEKPGITPRQREDDPDIEQFKRRRL